MRPNDPPKQEVIGQVLAWWRILDQQGTRVLNGIDRDEQQRDAVLYVMSLRSFHRAVTLAAHFSSVIREALDQFDRGFADTKTMRDVIEHFDAYLLGRGNLQKVARGAGRQRELAPYQVAGVFVEGAGVLVVTDGYDVRQVEVSAARAAASVLVRVALSELS